MTLTDYIAEADLIENSYYIGTYFNEKLERIYSDEIMNLDYLNYEVVRVEGEKYIFTIIISNKDYLDLLKRLHKTSPAQIRASMKYEKANIRRYTIKINKATESDIFAHLEKISNLQGYIKGLIRKDMEK